MEVVLTDYKVLVLSARNEFDSMVRIQQSRKISRIGFVVDEMKSLQAEVEAAIDNRAAQINSMDAACIVEAHRTLEASATAAGEIIVSGVNIWTTYNDYVSEDYVYNTIEELNVLISLFEFELLNLFSRFNSVTNMLDLLFTYQVDIQLFFALFESKFWT